MSVRVFSANGEVHQVQEDSDGYVDLGELRRDAGIGPSRALVVQRANGANEILPSSGKYLVRPDELFTDAPLAERG